MRRKLTWPTWAAVLQAVSRQPASALNLARRNTFPFTQLCECLGNLEQAGKVERVNGVWRRKS